MSRVSLTIATWDYDRVRALIDGRVTIEGCDINYLPMPVEECFERAYRHSEFEVAEIGMSPFLIALSRGLVDYKAVPVFLSRMFRHSAIYINADAGIERPEDLRGKRVGVPEYQMSAALWARGFLKDDYGVDAAEMEWVQGGLESFGRRDKFPLNLPDGFPLSSLSNGKTLAAMLAEGELDALISARAPSTFENGGGTVKRLFPNFREHEIDYFRRTGVFPIMHALGIRKDIVERHPWLPASVYKAFREAKAIADADLHEVTALKIGLPWVTYEWEATRAVMGDEFWPYGIGPNRKAIEAMARYSFEQGLAVKQLTVEDIFVKSTLEETHV